MTQAQIERYGYGCVSAIGPMSNVFQDERIAEGRVTIGGLIDTLDTFDPSLPVGTTDGYALHNPHSYRGYYVDLALSPDYAHAHKGGPAQTVASLRALALDAVGQEFPGWKGGTFRMNFNTPVWVAEVGDTGRYISAVNLIDGRVVIETEEETF